MQLANDFGPPPLGLQSSLQLSTLPTSQRAYGPGHRELQEAR
jgi:hypothetical protein